MSYTEEIIKLNIIISGNSRLRLREAIEVKITQVKKGCKIRFMISDKCNDIHVVKDDKKTALESYQKGFIELHNVYLKQSDHNFSKKDLENKHRFMNNIRSYRHKQRKY